MASCSTSDNRYKKHLNNERMKLVTKCLMDDTSKTSKQCSEEADESIAKFKEMIGDRT